MALSKMSSVDRSGKRQEELVPGA